MRLLILRRATPQPSMAEWVPALINDPETREVDTPISREPAWPIARKHWLPHSECGLESGLDPQPFQDPRSTRFQREFATRLAGRLLMLSTTRDVYGGLQAATADKTMKVIEHDVGGWHDQERNRRRHQDASCDRHGHRNQKLGLDALLE